MKKEFKIKIKKGQFVDKLWNNKKLCELLTEDNVFLEDLEILFKIKKQKIKEEKKK